MDGKLWIETDLFALLSEPIILFNMRLAQSSVIHFLSKLSASVLGFGATVYIAQLLGGGGLGKYSLAISVVSWLGLIGNMGVGSATTKMVSEQEEPSSYAIAGTLVMILFLVAFSIVVAVFHEYINEYVGFAASGYIIGMTVMMLCYNMVVSLLNGQHMVHLSGIFAPLKTGSRAGFQIAALFIGLGLSGLFIGYIVGYLIVTLIGIVVLINIFDNFSLPKTYHFKELYSYAKFSWLGGLRSKAFNWVDIVILGFFVPSTFIGYYTAAWNIAQFLIIFAASVGTTIFPEISETAVADDMKNISNLINTALTYAGLLLIPGLIGGIILGERILLIYGSKFTQAEMVLIVLIISTLFQAYQNQFTVTLNAIDRPDLAFRVNAVFIGANVILNMILIYSYGWLGAAVATASSVAISLCVAYYYLSSIIRINMPIIEIGKQWVAGGVMGIVVYMFLQVNVIYVGINSNILAVVLLVALGAAVYFFVLLVISKQFRITVADNLPSIRS